MPLPEAHPEKITTLGQEEWAEGAAKENLTTDQFTQIEIWAATAPSDTNSLA